MKSLTEDASPAASGMTSLAAALKTDLKPRLMADAIDPSMRCQLGEPVVEDVNFVHLPGNINGFRHIEKGAVFFRLKAWGRTWDEAVAFHRSNNRAAVKRNTELSKP